MFYKSFEQECGIQTGLGQVLNYNYFFIQMSKSVNLDDNAFLSR